MPKKRVAERRAPQLEAPDEVRERIQRHLKRLGLSDFDVEAHLKWAREEKVSELQSIERLLATAAGFKLARSIEWRFERSGLKVKKTLATFDWDFQPKLDRRTAEALFDLGFAARHEDVLVTGKTGTGKSHLLQALVLKACEKELTVRYARCVDLVDDLYAGLAEASSTGAIPDAVGKIEAEFRRAKELMRGWGDLIEELGDHRMPSEPPPGRKPQSTIARVLQAVRGDPTEGIDS